jgi:hypothetical protein
VRNIHPHSERVSVAHPRRNALARLAKMETAVVQASWVGGAAGTTRLLGRAARAWFQVVLSEPLPARPVSKKLAFSGPLSSCEEGGSSLRNRA